MVTPDRWGDPHVCLGRREEETQQLFEDPEVFKSHPFLSSSKLGFWHDCWYTQKQRPQELWPTLPTHRVAISSLVGIKLFCLEAENTTPWAPEPRWNTRATAFWTENCTDDPTWSILNVQSVLISQGTQFSLKILKTGLSIVDLIIINMSKWQIL